jgi:hypothetical protein
MQWLQWCVLSLPAVGELFQLARQLLYGFSKHMTVRNDEDKKWTYISGPCDCHEREHIHVKRTSKSSEGSDYGRDVNM